MKIAFVLASFFPQNRGGTEIYVLNLARYLRKIGSEVHIVVSSLNSEIQHYEYDGFTVHCFSIIEKASKEEYVGAVPPTGIKEFVDILCRLQVDIVHFHSFNRAINSWHLKYAKEAGFRTVFTAHLGGFFCQRGDFLYQGKETCNGQVQEAKCLSCLFSQRRPGLSTYIISMVGEVLSLSPIQFFLPPSIQVIKYKLLEFARVKTYCDAIVSISSWIQTAYELNGVNNSVLVRQGIDTSKFLKERYYEKASRIVISFVGRMHPFKGIHLLVDALLQIKPNPFLLRIVCVRHDDAYYKEIKSKVANLDACEWYEGLSSEQVSEKLNGSDLFCLPSLSNEASPLVILEAFSKGIPVIGSDYPAIKDSIREGVDGLLFENGNLESLLAVLQRIIEEKDLLAQLRENVKPPRSMDDVGGDMYNIYKGLLK